jgi:rhodanese-related sulfurtransferase
MILGLAMVFAGLFTIMTDLHVFNMQWMLLTPNTHADELFAKLPKDKVTIFYCASGARAMEAYLKLADANKDVAKVMYFDAMVSCNSENCSISVNEPLGL